MDFLTQQFIVTAKKIRDDLRSLLAKFDVLHEDVSNLSNFLQNNQCHAIREDHNPDEENQDNRVRVVRAELSTPVAIGVETKAKERYPIFGLLKTAFEIVGIAAAIGYAFIAYQQWKEMRATTNAAFRQVEIGRESLAEARESFRVDERAWVGIGEPIKTPFKLGSQPYFGFFIVNTGKTPALNVWHVIKAKSYPKGEPFKPVYDPFSKNPSLTPMFPGAKHSTITTTTHPIYQTDLDHLGSGSDILYVYGIITYMDIFKVRHETHFCEYLLPNLSDFAACKTYNTAD